MASDAPGFAGQRRFSLRFGWGLEDLAVLAPTSDIHVVVDVLSFSMAVSVAVGHGARVFPYFSESFWPPGVLDGTLSLPTSVVVLTSAVMPTRPGLLPLDRDSLPHVPLARASRRCGPGRPHRSLAPRRSLARRRRGHGHRRAVPDRVRSLTAHAGWISADPRMAFQFELWKRLVFVDPAAIAQLLLLTAMGRETLEDRFRAGEGGLRRPVGRCRGRFRPAV